VLIRTAVAADRASPGSPSTAPSAARVGRGRRSWARAATSSSERSSTIIPVIWRLAYRMVSNLDVWRAANLLIHGRRRRSRSRPAARLDVRPRRRRGAARMGADQARDRGITRSPARQATLRLSPLAPAQNPERREPGRANGSSCPEADLRHRSNFGIRRHARVGLDPVIFCVCTRGLDRGPAG
jgi:hypothetical protein